MVQGYIGLRVYGLGLQAWRLGLIPWKPLMSWTRFTYGGTISVENTKHPQRVHVALW